MPICTQMGERNCVDLGERGSGKVVGGAGRVETVIIICGI